MTPMKGNRILEFKINKTIFIFVFFLSLLLATFSHSLTLTKFMLCTNNNFVKETHDEEIISISSIDSNTIEKKTITVLDQLKCYPDEIQNGDTLNISDFETLYAVAHFNNMDIDAHREVSMYWIFEQDPSLTQKIPLDYPNTYYSEKLGKFFTDFKDKIRETEERCNIETGVIRIICSIVDVIISPSLHFRTFTSKNFDKNYHTGKWVVKIFELGTPGGAHIDQREFTVTK
jgi:hypothetical protein